MKEDPPPPANLFDDVEDDADDEDVGAPLVERPPRPGDPLAIVPLRVRGFDLSPTDRRELCGVHGWVGRLAFQRDRHDLCEFAEAIEDVHDDDIEDDDDEDEDGPPPVLLRDVNGYRGRNPEVARAKTISVKKITRVDLEIEEARLRRFTESETYRDLIAQRPKTRGDCRGGERPCPWIGCRHNLYLEVSETGSIKFNRPDLEPWEVVHSCALDEAEMGGLTLESTAERGNITRERARQLEVKALFKLKMLGALKREDV